jgi:hypothetical protein
MSKNNTYWEEESVQSSLETYRQTDEKPLVKIEVPEITDRDLGENSQIVVPELVRSS